MIRPDWIDWSKYLIVGERGMPLRYATLEKFEDHLHHFLVLTRTNPELIYTSEVATMTIVDWNAVVANHTKNGKFEHKNCIDWFKAELDKQIAKVQAENEAKAGFEKNMIPAIHKVFIDAGKDVIARPTVIEYALRYLNVPLSQHDESYDYINHWLTNNDEKVFGTMLGPSGGLVRCKGEDGKVTSFFKENESSVRFGIIKRNSKNST